MQFLASINLFNVLQRAPNWLCACKISVLALLRIHSFPKSTLGTRLRRKQCLTSSWNSWKSVFLIFIHWFLRIGSRSKKQEVLCNLLNLGWIKFFLIMHLLNAFFDLVLFNLVNHVIIVTLLYYILLQLTHLFKSLLLTLKLLQIQFFFILYLSLVSLDIIFFSFFFEHLLFFLHFAFLVFLHSEFFLGFFHFL